MKLESKLILSSKNATTGVALYTFVLSYPRVILAEVNTHRVLSRNTASSRAIPSKKQRERVLNNPFIPITIGQNQKGMQAGGELSGWRRTAAYKVWEYSRYPMVFASYLLDKLGAHKQVVNRIVEPWTFTQQVVTATDWKNVFKLRNHGDAEPHFHVLAAQMQEQVEFVEKWYRLPHQSGSQRFDVNYPLGIGTIQTLQPGEWHLPFVDTDELQKTDIETLKRVSVARCARVSYILPENGKRSEISRDIELCDRLSSSGHWCYDETTEALTLDGWKSWPIITKTDKIAAVDISNFSIKFETPVNLVIKEFDGKMYQVAGQQVDLCVTPEHKMVISYRKSGGAWSDFYFDTALNVADQPRRYAKSGLLSERTQTANPFGIDRNVFAKFIGFFIGDGHADGSRVEFNLRLEKKISFLQALGLPNVENKGRFKIQIDNLSSWLDLNCYDANYHKIIPAMYLTAPLDEVNNLFCGLRNSDGSTKKNTWVYGSTSLPLLGQIQALAHLNNQVASIERVDTEREARTDYQSNYYRVNFSSRCFPKLDIGQKGRALTYKNSWVPYKGLVYCATVSTGALLVRRNGKVVVSGNSPFEHAATPLPVDEYSGNFRSWKQYRKYFPNENGEN